MIYYRGKNGVKIAEIWYNPDERPGEAIDVIRYRFVPEILKKAFSVEEKHTLILDLSKTAEDLFSLFRKNTKYEINRAKERDAVVCGTFFERGEDNNEKLAKYLDFFNAFAQSKNRTPCTLDEFGCYIKNGSFCVRCAEKDSQFLVMHAYIVSDGRARLHQSASHFRNVDDAEFRNLAGRANRLLHWDDMLYFKALGIQYYDFGGLYLGSTDKEKILIAQFKQAFGGEVLREYLYLSPVSILGWLSIFPHALHRIYEKTVWRLEKAAR
ncbi:hypothetical protein FACS1894161_1730 [Spirochaetia bacterium]|nr:hypothetical protein FACS1894161_1730 [Spirochaetia bacterium]